MIFVRDLEPSAVLICYNAVSVIYLYRFCSCCLWKDASLRTMEWNFHQLEFLQLATPQEMSRLKSQMKKRSDLDWKEVKWSTVRELRPSDIEIVQARVISVQPEVRHSALKVNEFNPRLQYSIPCRLGVQCNL